MRLIWIGLVVMLAGCTVAMNSANKAADRLPPETTEQYRQGFREGCNTVLVEQCMHTTGERTRDEARMRADKEYALGWFDGARQCNVCGSSYIFVPSMK